MAPASRTVSLRAHLLLLVIGTTVPALLIAAVLVRQVVNDNRQAVQQRLQESARATAAIVDAELGGTIRALQGLAQSNSLTTGDIPLFYDQARRLVAEQPTWGAVGLWTVDGRALLNTARAPGERSDTLPAVADRASFDRAVVTRAPVVGDLRIGALSSNKGFVVRVPVLRGGRVIYMLSVWMTSQGLARSLLRDDPPFGQLVRGVVDGSGTIVARTPNGDRFVGQKATRGFLMRYGSPPQGTYRDVSLDGTPVYSAFSRAPLSHWTAAVAVPVSVVDAPFRSSMLALAGIAVMLLAVGGGGTFVISRRMTRDISRSAAAAESLASGVVPAPGRSDVTELQRLLDAIARSAALLERGRQERDEQLARADEARAQAEAANRSKDEFLALLGHELRNPLAPALTAIHLMKLRSGGQPSRERDIVERQIRHMARLVDDLLDVSRLRRGAIELRRERMDLGDAIARAVEMTAPSFAAKQHTLDVQVQPGLVVDGDIVRLAQVVANLLSNAAKYTEPHGAITLRASAGQGVAIVECRDNGIGMAPELRERAFDMFVQGQQGLDRREGGLGLGLAVARALVERHGGTIEAASDGLGRGSAFTVRLPLAGAAEPAAAPDRSRPAAAPHPLRAGRILVVDDNADALETLLEALRASGCEAVGASTAAEALEVALRTPADVAVLDIGLPDTNGFDLARSLRALGNGAPMRLVALTGYGREQDRASARAAGFDAFLVKPVDVQQLLATVRDLSGGPVSS